MKVSQLAKIVIEKLENIDPDQVVVKNICGSGYGDLKLECGITAKEALIYLEYLFRDLAVDLDIEY